MSHKPQELTALRELFLCKLPESSEEGIYECICVAQPDLSRASIPEFLILWMEFSGGGAAATCGIYEGQVPRVAGRRLIRTNCQ